MYVLVVEAGGLGAEGPQAAGMFWESQALHIVITGISANKKHSHFRNYVNVHKHFVGRVDTTLKVP